MFASRRSLLCWTSCLLTTTLVVVLVGVLVPGSLVDLGVYRTAGVALVRDVPLYTGEFPSPLPFTYPPFSALVFTWLGAIPLPVAITVITVVGLVGLSATITLVTPNPTRWAIPAASVTVGLGLVLEPVRETLLFGQINLVLLGLVAVDCLLPKTRHPRGMLIGLAAAAKLTPAFFVLFFLARRQTTPVAVAAITFLCVTGLAVLASPEDSVTYWTATVFDADRVGGAGFATNQSLRGALARLGLAPAEERAAWLLLVCSVSMLGWYGARQAHEQGDRVLALLVVAATGLLVSPVSWSHHWVWVAPALVVGFLRVRRAGGWRPATALPAVLACGPFAAGHRLLPHGDDQELAWAWWQHLIGNGYLLTALVFVAWSALPRERTPEPLRELDRVGAA